MQETWVQSLVQEDYLEKEMAAHSSSLIWEIPWTVEPGGLQSIGLQRVRQDLVTEQQLDSRRREFSVVKDYLKHWVLLLPGMRT